MLDRSMPYDEVYGEPGVKWSQHGVLYNLLGIRVGGAEEAPPAPAGSAAAVKGSSFGTMSNDALKAQVAIYGGTWAGRLAAIRFLEGAE